MKLFLICVRDRAINAFLKPFFLTHLGGAERAFADEVNNPQSELNKHPEDYDLFQLGTFDDGTGLFEVGVPRQISIGKNVYKSAPMPAMSPHIVGQDVIDDAIQRRNGVR